MSWLLQQTRVPRSLPRGRSRLPREVVLLSQRARLLEATVAVAGTQGFAAMTIGDVISAARVSRTTFYEHFSDREECFVAAYEELSGLHFEYVLSASKQAASLSGRLQSGVRAYLEALAGDPAYARVCTVEVLAAGPRAAKSRDIAHARYARLLSEWHAKVRGHSPGVPQMPQEVFDCAVGGAVDLVATRVRDGDTEELTRLVPVIVTFVLNLGGMPEGRELAAALSAARAHRS